VFEGSVATNAQGIYQFRVLAEGRTFRSLRFTREQTLTGAVWRGGDDDSPNGHDDPNHSDDRVCMLISCLFRNRGLIELLRKQGIDPEELRRCFSVFCRKPTPNAPVHLIAASIEERLRTIVRDDSTLRAVMTVIKPELE
jgi:hypothetical protein